MIRRWARFAAGIALGLAWLLVFSPLRADAPAPDAGTEDFGQYLVDHQNELAPFFKEHTGDFARQGVPVVLEWLGRVMLVTLALGWVLDVLLGRGYSTLFAPTLARWGRALVYATGRLALSVIVIVLLGLAMIPASGLSHLADVAGALLIFFALVALLVQVIWVNFLYRTDIFISLLFYITLVVIHGFAALAIAAPMAAAPASAQAREFIDGTIATKLQEDAAGMRHDLEAEGATHDDAVAQAQQLQDQIDQDKAQIVALQKQITDEKVSPGYLFSQLVKVHARGDLAAAQSGLADFLQRFPSGDYTGLAKGQLMQVQTEVAEQAAEKKQAAADAARAAAQARADLLARANRGEVTLSEMRNALIGKTRAQVSAIFGPPNETASDRWGFSRPMILNSMTGAHTGLTIYFSEGEVQGVDYFYGAGGAQ